MKIFKDNDMSKLTHIQCDKCNKKVKATKGKKCEACIVAKDMAILYVAFWKDESEGPSIEIDICLNCLDKYIISDFDGVPYTSAKYVQDISLFNENDLVDE